MYLKRLEEAQGRLEKTCGISRQESFGSEIIKTDKEYLYIQFCGRIYEVDFAKESMKKLHV